MKSSRIFWRALKTLRIALALLLAPAIGGFAEEPEQLPIAGTEYATDLETTTDLPFADSFVSTNFVDPQCPTGCDRLIPNMLGDFIGGFAFGPAPAPNTQPRAVARAMGRFKVADNNSPIPRTRLLYSYNYFDQPFRTDGNLHRNFLGGEGAFLDGLVSAQIKFAVDRYDGFSGAADKSDVSNIETTLKALAYRTTSTAISGGVAIGWPTANLPGTLTDDNYLFAPFVGYLFAPEGSNWFIQGFEQLDVPTESMDLLLLHTDVGIGFLLRERPDAFISMIAPTAELHLYTPIGSASGPYRDLAYQDTLNMTLGATTRLGRAVTLALGSSFPISSQRDYDYEFQLHLNWFFGVR